VSIRLQLLLIALTTLILPWAGCQYARELETALRVSQEKALEASADTIAHALAAQPDRVFRDPGDGEPYRASEGDLYAFALRAQPLLDGYREDWDIAADPKPLEGNYPARLLVGATERFLFLFVEVDDPHFLAEPSDPHPDRDRFDRVDVTIEQPDSSLQTYFFATGAPGPIEAQTIVRGADGTERAAGEPRVQAFWLQTAAGYRLEARVPLSLLGPRLWVAASDGSGRESRSGTVDPAHGGRLFMTTPGLAQLLAIFIPGGTRASVVDASELKLGTTGSLRSAPVEDPPDAEGTWYRRFVTVDSSSWPAAVSYPDRIAAGSVRVALSGRASAEWLRGGGAGNQEIVLLAAAPITIDGQVRGAVVLEQAGDQLLELRDRALNRLFDLTVLAAALAVVFAFGVATYISLRIGRLRTAADTAVGSDGRIRLDMPESASSDEIGALARGFERLLARLNEHALYLRTLGGKLAHELRTPLSIVRSSLDNLESEGIRDDQRGYVTRAREGAQRLQSILSALGAAARVEESIKQAERVNFDLRAVLESAVAGYRDAFPRTRIELDLPPDACYMRGAPELIVQMLDKLIENAVDFCPPSGVITVRLARTGSEYELTVGNDGPPIPPAVLERLFESLFEHRQGHDDKPHFGLGLYIVRLIAEFHEGKALAANRPNEVGAVFTVLLPLI
jgi:two-component system, OmpR family, sensor histidine kinase ChvG